MGLGGGSGGGGSTSTTEASIAPELRPLFSQTGRIVQGAQATVPQVQGPGFSFGLVPQVGGGFDPGQFNASGISAGTGFTTQPSLFQQIPAAQPAAPAAPTAPVAPAAPVNIGLTPSEQSRLAFLDLKDRGADDGLMGNEAFELAGLERRQNAASPGASTFGPLAGVTAGGVGTGNVVGPTGQATDAETGGPPITNSILSEFLFQNPQIIPQATAGQQGIIRRQRERLEGPIITGQEQFAGGLAQRFGGIRAPEQTALDIASGLGSVTPQEQAGLNISGGFGNLRFPEFAALAQINELTGGPLGSSPATQAALEAARVPVLNELALAGLGTSGAVGGSLGGVFAPILAQEQALRAQLAPVLAGIGEAQRRGDQVAASNFLAVGEAARRGSTQAAQINQQIGAAMRAGDIETANFLAAQGKELVDRETQFQADFGTSEEAQRALLAQQFESEQRDAIRRNNQALGLTTGVLGGFPSTLGQITTQESSGGGK